jgi:branched-chain amino acid transport system ATP-binding protein
MPSSPLPILELQKISKNYGGLHAVIGLDMKVEQGEIFGLIGPNGAGKSTALDLIDGSLPLTKGRVIFLGEDVSRLGQFVRAKRGIARVFQRNVLFSSFTVVENVMIGLHLHSGMGLMEAVFPWGASNVRKKGWLREKALGVLGEVGLHQKADDLAVNLPHGSQRSLGIAIAMATGGKLFLLDEPLTGMNAQEISFVMGTINKLRNEKGVTIIVVEHNMKAVIGLCDRVVVLDYGMKIAEGLPVEAIKDPKVIQAYLGAEQDAISNQGS